jgi:hypothetical protein
MAVTQRDVNRTTMAVTQRDVNRTTMAATPATGIYSQARRKLNVTRRHNIGLSVQWLLLV